MALVVCVDVRQIYCGVRATDHSRTMPCNLHEPLNVAYTFPPSVRPYFTLLPASFPMSSHVVPQRFARMLSKGIVVAQPL